MTGSGGSFSSPHHPFGFSQIPADPTFRSAALNAVAIIPLLSSSDSTATHSLKSFSQLWRDLGRHSTASPLHQHQQEDELLLIVANSSLTRPGDWRYQETPLKAFHWQYGCQRLHLFDGRPESKSNMVQDRLLNPTLTRDWIDLVPSRRTAAVIGVLNVHDCQTQADLERAKEELHQWATQRYATPPYQVTAHGKTGVERDQPVERLFVFDSFDETCQHIDLNSTANTAGNANNPVSILAFPPSDQEHSQMMDLHLNVVVNDLAVAIFQSLEAKIRLSDELAKEGVVPINPPPGQASRRNISRYISGGSTDKEEFETEPRLGAPSNLSLRSMAGLVSPENKLAQDSSALSLSSASSDTASPLTSISPKGGGDGTPSATHRASTAANLRRLSGATNQVTPPQLLTPLDDYYEVSTAQLSAKDTDALKRRDMGRREKLAADLSLLAGSPLDAYERYLKAAHMSKQQPDPLWYAMSLVGCAASHISMAEGGGYNVDEYLENNFSLPEDILAVAFTGGVEAAAATASGKKTFPEVVFALCEEAMAILNRHPKLAPFHAGLLLQLALYTAESAETHLRCRWGEGPGSFAGGEEPPYRWERALQVKPSLLKTKDGRDMIDINVMNRVKTICDLLQQGVSVPDLDPATRLDIAMQAARLLLEGIPGTKWKKSDQSWIQLPRKAAFFSVVAAEAMSTLSSNEGSHPTLENLWVLACQLYSRRPNEIFGSSKELGSYGWATLRASTLHALSLQGTNSASLEASEMLLNLLEEIRPSKPITNGKTGNNNSLAPSRRISQRLAAGTSDNRDMSELTADQQSQASGGSDPAEETYAASVTKRIQNFIQVSGVSSMLTAQAKWANETPKPPVLVPLAGSLSSPSNMDSLLALPCVWPSIGYDLCAVAQRECSERITALKKGLSRSSAGEERALSPDVPAEYVAVPVSVSPTWSLQPFENFEIDLVKKKVQVEDKGVMATFYNPFDKGGKQRLIVPVAAEEERVVTLRMKNWLTVPLTVNECRLEFSEIIRGRINSAPVSFVLPPLADEYSVQFPFTILAPHSSDLSKSTEFEVQGISFTCLNHSFNLSLLASSALGGDSAVGDVAEPASYPQKPKKKKQEPEDQTKLGPKIEALPSQPRLHVRYSSTTNAFNPGSQLKLDVTNGEVISTPLFELANAPGPKRHGLLKRVQISVHGIPGTSEKLVFDSDSPEVDESNKSESDFLEELSGDNCPALKVRMLPGTMIDLDSLNSATNENAKNRTLGFQIALANNLKARFNNSDAEITLRIRYAGTFTETKEVWRKFDMPLSLKYFRGPRVTSITFRADLMDHKPFPLLLQRLNDRRRTMMDQTPFESNESDLTCRVGLDRTVHIAGGTFVAIVTILNDSKNDIVLYKPDGAPVSSFASSSIPTLTVPRGVKVSIPISVPRLPRSSASGDEIIKATTLEWTTIKDPNNPQYCAQGRIATQSEKILSLIAKAPSFIPSIFEPPCSIRLEVQGNDSTNGFSATAAVGEPIDLAVDVTIASWVSAEIRSRCEYTVEFFAVWLESSVETPSSRDHVWCGMVRRRFEMVDKMNAKHAAKVVLLLGGCYALSACVRLTQDNKGDEVWWAPHAAIITVDPTRQ